MPAVPDHMPTDLPDDLRDLHGRLVRLLAATVAAVEETYEAIRRTRATIARCRANGSLARPDPPREMHE